MTFQGSYLFQRGVRRNASLEGDLGLWSLPDTCSRSTALLLTVTDSFPKSGSILRSSQSQVQESHVHVQSLPSHPKKHCVSTLHLYSQKKPTVCNYCQFIFHMCHYTGYPLSVSPSPLSIFLCILLSWSTKTTSVRLLWPLVSRWVWSMRALAGDKRMWWAWDQGVYSPGSLPGRQLWLDMSFQLGQCAFLGNFLHSAFLSGQ